MCRASGSVAAAWETPGSLHWPVRGDPGVLASAAQVSASPSHPCAHLHLQQQESATVSPLLDGTPGNWQLNFPTDGTSRCAAQRGTGSPPAQAAILEGPHSSLRVSTSTGIPHSQSSLSPLFLILLLLVPDANAILQAGRIQSSTPS